MPTFRPTASRRAVLLGALAAPMVVRNAGAADVIKIGTVNPLTGPLALYGGELSDCYQLAADAMNASGGVLGRQIQLVRSDAASPQQAISTVDQLATRDNVELFVGSYASAISNSGSDAAMRYNKVWWETNALAKELTERGLPNYIRSGSNAQAFAQMSVRAIIELIAPALKKQPSEIGVAIEHEDSIYGTSIAQIQQASLTKAGVKVLANNAHAARSTDLTDSVLRAKRLNPDVWLETGYVPDGNLLLRAARDQGFAPPARLWVGVGDTAETREALGADGVEGMLVTAYAQPVVPEAYGPGAAAFLAAYKARFKRSPLAPQGMGGYVGMMMLFEVLKAAGSTDLEKIRAAAAAIDRPANSYANGFGMKFDDTMQNIRAIPTIVQWQSGVQTEVFPAAAVTPGSGLKSLSGA